MPKIGLYIKLKLLKSFIIWQGRIVQSDWSISGLDFAVMPSAAVAGHYESVNALQNKAKQSKTKESKAKQSKAKQNKTVKTVSTRLF